MINFDSLTLTALLNEIKPCIENARVQKIRQPNRQELLLTLRINSRNYTLFISTKPSFAHLCLLEEDYKQYRKYDFPQSPPMFCMLLRKYLENAKIEKVIQPDFERIIEFYFTAYGELGDKINLVLSVELMGKHSNMILYNSDTKIIIGCSHNVGEEKSKIRELAGNLKYIYPPKYYKKDILNMNSLEFIDMAKVIDIPFVNWLNENFYNISVPIAKEVCEKLNIPIDSSSFILTKENLENIFNEIKNVLSLTNIHPTISENFEKFSLSDIYHNKLNTVNAMVDLYFGKNSYLELLTRKRKALMTITDREIKKVKRLIKKLSLGDEVENKIALYKQTADTLMANMFIQNNNKNNITLKNVYTNEDITIELDNTLSLNDNAQNYYKLYTKTKKTKETNKELFVKYEEKENYLLSIKASINLAENIETLEEIEEETANLNPIQIKSKQDIKKKKVIVEKIEHGDFEIFIGKNNKQNDYIVSKLAASEDFWFHVHGNFGSHVIVKSKNKTENLPDNILLLASILAAKYSEKRTDSKVDVIYTKRKYLRKPPGANLGYVTYKNEKEITVEM